MFANVVLTAYFVPMHLPIRHHFIPEFQLHEFTHDDGYLRATRRVEHGFSEIFRPSPAKLFRQTHLYSATDSDEKKTPSGEVEFFEPVDRLMSRLFHKVVATLRNGEVPDMPPSTQLSFLDMFLRLRHARLPNAFQEVVKETSDGDRFLEIIGGDDEDREAINRIFSDPDEKRRLLSNATLAARTRKPSPELAGLFSSGAIAFGICRNKHSFIISDAELYDRKNMPKGPDDLWFPLTADIAFRHDRNLDRASLEVLDTSLVRRINLRLFQRGSIIASRSDDLLRSLAKAECPSVRI